MGCCRESGASGRGAGLKVKGLHKTGFIWIPTESSGVPTFMSDHLTTGLGVAIGSLKAEKCLEQLTERRSMLYLTVTVLL